MEARALPPTVDLLDVDDDLAAAFDPCEARPRLPARLLLARPGDWHYRPEGAVLLVLRGALARRVRVGNSGAAEILGAGDVIQLANLDADDRTIASDTEWTVLRPTAVAVIDDAVAAAVAASPPLFRCLLDRAVARLHRLSVQMAIAGQVGIEQRLLAMLWHLADRWGTVTRDGVLVPLELSHRLLAELVSAQRPTVSTASRRLIERGAVARAQGRGWLLLQPPEVAPVVTPSAASMLAPADAA